MHILRSGEAYWIRCTTGKIMDQNDYNSRDLDRGNYVFLLHLHLDILQCSKSFRKIGEKLNLPTPYRITDNIKNIRN